MGVVIWKGHWPSSKEVAGVPETAESRDDEGVLILPFCRRPIEEKAVGIRVLPLLSSTLPPLLAADVLWTEG